MDILGNLELGLLVAVSWQNLLFCFLGVLTGTLIGVLPGIGPLATIAMLLPLTYSFEPTTALIMLAGIYYGAMYGGSTTAILVNLPGETASVITCIDGHQMARQGRAGPALAIAAIGSLFAGTVGTVLIALVGAPLARLALDFGSPEYFSVMLMGLVAAAVLAHGDMVKALAMLVLGLILGMVGTDVASGMKRFGFGFYELADGIEVVIIAVGFFAVAEIVSNLTNPENRIVFSGRIRQLFPTMDDLRQSVGAILRGTAIGSFFGVLPGTTPAIAAFSSYMIEKKVAKDPSRFGHGAIEGVAGPESANNADAQCKFIPMLALGIPASGTMALMLGAMMVHGITPGPTLTTQHPGLFWGLVVSMWIGNLFLVVLNLPLIGVWVSLLKVPYRMLFPAIMAFSTIGILSTNNQPFDLYLLAIFGVVGVLWRVLECSPIPLMLGLVLGPMMEENLRRSLQVADGDFTVFIRHPISLTFLILTAIILAIAALPAVRRVTNSDEEPV